MPNSQNDGSDSKPVRSLSLHNGAGLSLASLILFCLCPKLLGQSSLSPTLTVGYNIIHAIGKDRVGNFATTQITVTWQTVTNQAQIKLISGNNQTGKIGSAVAASPVVALTDSLGNPAANQQVIFKVTQNNGMVSAESAANSSVVATTNAQGRAQVQWTNNQIGTIRPGFAEAAHCRCHR